MIVLKLLATVWGACLASFINTVIWRLLNQISLFDPQRSYCDSCHQQLIWWQLIPVIGWLIQKGRCHFCHASIGCYSTFSELINGWLWYELFILDPKIIMALLILSTSLLVCSATDYFAQWIWPIWLIGLFSLFWLLNQKWQWLRLSAAIAILGGLLIMSFLTSNGIGIGDIELIFILQLCTSIKFVATTVLIAAGLGILSLRSRYQALPFVPYLSLGIVITLILTPS